MRLVHKLGHTLPGPLGLLNLRQFVPRAHLAKFETLEKCLLLASVRGTRGAAQHPTKHRMSRIIQPQNTCSSKAEEPWTREREIGQCVLCYETWQYATENITICFFFKY